MAKPAAPDADPAESFRKALLDWYDGCRRDLPWRSSTEFYPVWISEIMLQQTRVEAATPHYLRFLARFPSVAALATAAEPDVLAAWSGLGYYSRARNLHRAAKRIAREGIPADYDGILALPGAGPYTAAAVASIVFGQACAAVDGNVIRVVSRLTDDDCPSESPAARRRFGAVAEGLLDRSRAGDFNQAMMELGATVCVPRSPRCGCCPVAEMCAARRSGRAAVLPVRAIRKEPRDRTLDLLLLGRGPGEIFLILRGGQESRLAGFWEPPVRTSANDRGARMAAEFRHRIVNDRILVRVWIRAAFPDEGVPAETEAGAGRWFGLHDLGAIPLGGIARKAVAAAWPGLAGLLPIPGFAREV